MFRNPLELRDEPKPNAGSTRDPFGRLGPEDTEPDTEITAIKNPTTLQAPVGDTGQNRRRDVAKTEQLLDKAGTLDLKKTDGPNGFWGTRTSDATKMFQKQNGLKVDAEINPNGPTIQKLSQITDTRDATKRRKERRDQRHVDAAAQGKKNAIDQVINNATRWHFEDRDAKNKPLPNSMRRADRAGFEMYPQWQNAEHQNDVGFPEVKYVHPDGREVIYDGDTRKVITDPKIKGTFNYANAPAREKPPEDAAELFECLSQEGVLKHFLLDWLPYNRLGNTRDK